MTSAPVDAPTAVSPRTYLGRSLVVAAALVAYGLFVLLRLFLHAGDPSVFVDAGDRFTNPHVATSLTVAHHSEGYDGQMFERLARNPVTTARTEFGTTFDRPAYRQQRIGYPTIVWLFSGGGEASEVPWAMIGVNLLAVGLLAAVAADLAHRAGRSPALGLLAVAWPGILVGVARDLSEPLAGALLLAAVLALRRRRWIAATVTLVAAALVRETTLLLPAAILGAWAIGHLPVRGWLLSLGNRDPETGHQRGDRVPLLVGLAPIAVAGAWHEVLAHRWHGVPQTGPKIPSFVGVPVLPLLRQLATWVLHPDVVGVVQLLQVALLVFVIVTFAAVLRDRAAGHPHERLALVGALAIMTMLPSWDRNVVFLRWADEAVLLGFAIALTAKRVDWRSLARATAVLFGATALIWVSIA